MQKHNASHGKIMFLAQAAVIAALYAGLTLAAPMLSYGNLQFRFAEALTLLPVLTPAAIPGLTVGCAIANIASPELGALDILFGSLATLLAALCSYWLRGITVKKQPLLSALMPVLFNGAVIGLMLALVLFDEFRWANFLLFAGEIAASELILCYALGLPLIALLRKVPMFKTERE
ncbi:MAG: QueT transporter family protein [Firmicutes bacterium]|nr:QueT transporter family protein [Bacillota bacterium]